MGQKKVSTSELKAHCAEVIDRVAKGREAVVIVRRGRPVAKLVPIDEGSPNLFGFARGCVSIRGDVIQPVDEEWEALQ